MHDLKLRRRRVRHAIILSSEPSTTKLAARACADAGIREVVTVVGSRELGEVLDSLPATADVLICEDAAARGGFLSELSTDRRENVVAVVPRLRNQLTEDAVKFELEPVDVPWYSRRVTAVGATLHPSRCHGVALGCVVLGPTNRPSLARMELAQPSVAAVCEAVLAAGGELYTHPVPVEEMSGQAPVRAAV